MRSSRIEGGRLSETYGTNVRNMNDEKNGDDTCS